MRPTDALLRNDDAEAAVLSAMLSDEQAIIEAGRVIRPDDFSRPAHERIYRAFGRLAEHGSKADVLTLAAELQRTGELEAVGGKDYLATLIDVVPTTAHVAHHAALVRDAAQRRTLLVLADGMKAAVTDGTDLRTIAQHMTEQLTPVAVERAGKGFQALHALVGPVLSLISDREGNPAIAGVPTGYPEIDEHTFGFRAGELIVLAGAPGSGKTALALNIALNVATAGIRVGVFSAEATASQLVERLFNAEARVSSSATRSGRLSRTEAAEVVEASSRLAALPMHIDETSRPRIDDILAKARHLKAKCPDLRLLIVDYLQLVTPSRTRGKEGNRAEELTEISYDLQGVAKDLGVAVIALSQVDAKAAESREGSRPLLRELRWSQGMREAAHFVGLVHRPQTDNPNAGSFLDVDFAKARDLPAFTARLHWQGAWMRVASRRDDTPTLRVVG